MLDIGGAVGAVVVRLPEATTTGELMACPRNQPAAHFHTGVHRHPGPGVDAWIAVFPEVHQGPHCLLTNGVEHTPFDVIGGQVTYLEVGDDPR